MQFLSSNHLNSNFRPLEKPTDGIIFNNATSRFWNVFFHSHSSKHRVSISSAPTTFQHFFFLLLYLKWRFQVQCQFAVKFRPVKMLKDGSGMNMELSRCFQVMYDVILWGFVLRLFIYSAFCRQNWRTKERERWKMIKLKRNSRQLFFPRNAVYCRVEGDYYLRTMNMNF